MILVCDIGNSRIKFGQFDNSKLTNYTSFTELSESVDFIANQKPSVIAFSSVSPGKLNHIINSIKTKISSKLFFVDKTKKLNLVINYSTPASLGIDRICAAEGALALINQAEHLHVKDNGDFIMTIDFGTATTINLVKLPNVFEGGVIMPGMKVMSKSLNLETAQLPEINFESPKSIIGKTTEENINNGIFYSTIGLIEEVRNKIKMELHSEVTKIFITGGNAKLMMGNLNFDFIYSEELVLLGIRSIYDLNTY